MKIFQALVLGAFAAKGGKKKAEREAAKAAAEGAAEAAAAEAERLSSTPELGPGDTISMKNYGDNERKTWDVVADNDGVTSLTFKFVGSKTSMDWASDDCPDYIMIEPQSEKGEALDTVYFCGSGDAATSYFFHTWDVKTFVPRQKFGLKGWDHAWDTFARKAKVTFVSDSTGNGGDFEIVVGEQQRASPCRTRSDCQHVGLNRHVCAINDVTKEKICKEVDCTRHDHCTNGEDGAEIQKCFENKCTKTECRLREHCKEQEICSKNKCVAVDCTLHKHCDQSDGPKRCSATVCEPVGCVGKSDCKPNQLCVENECVTHECLGHLTCEVDFPERCKDGVCKCIGRECKKQECTKHSHCDDGGLCDNNPLKDPSFTCYNEVDGVKTCRNHAQCGPKAKCQDKRCVSVECRTNADCSDKKGENAWRCHDENTAKTDDEVNTCYAVDCNKHDQCPTKHACQDNACVPVTCRTNADCTGNFLCNKPDRSDPTQNFCKAVDCIGHKACLDHSNQDCKDGKCLCIENSCITQTCVTSAHCKGEKERCHNNQCVEAECSSHDHCLTAFPDSNGFFKAAKCFPNCYTEKGRKYCLPKCEIVECRTLNDCNGKEICDKVKNECKKVDCRGHGHCKDKEICFKNVCKPVKCTTNYHCGKSEICENNECKSVDCKGHDQCDEKARCIKHECVPRECTKNDHCSKKAGSFQKCDKIDGKCIDIECIGHNACNTLKLNSFGDDCSEGHCLCLGNKCYKQTCRTNDHCGDMERCVGNTCESVDCTSHDHCDDKQVCKDNICIDVQCRDREHCQDKQICGGQEHNNTCIPVDCTSHEDCENFQGRVVKYSF
ncbi:unnamed protein product [Oikopleura dioica]|uniref:CUB domain-containing protein n=1 Tax=Oikopleura dioica TaxID=34765 RepID=E4WUB9_OIKDI|nr:unnamed protein product [Oikopleura dioica]